MNNEYYVIIHKSTAGAVPLDPTPYRFFDEEEPVELDFAYMQLREPFLKNTKMVDYHASGVGGAISKKIYDILAPLNIKGIQLIPASILNPKSGEEFDKYYAIHIYNYITCLDHQRAIIEGDFDDIIMIEKMALDGDVLTKIPLEERLIFRLGEMYTYQLWHESIVHKVLAVNPDGIKFERIEDFDASSGFSSK